MELLKFLTNLSHMHSHDLISFGLDLKAFILEAIRTWHVQHELADHKCDTVCFWYNDFLSRGWNKNQIQAVLRVWLPDIMTEDKK